MENEKIEFDHDEKMLLSALGIEEDRRTELKEYLVNKLNETQSLSRAIEEILEEKENKPAEMVWLVFQSGFIQKQQPHQMIHDLMADIT